MRYGKNLVAFLLINPTNSTGFSKRVASGPEQRQCQNSMSEKMPDRMPKYMSNRMPDRVPG